MTRIFYFTGYRLTVLHWNGKMLEGTTSFEPTESGLERFRNYLLETVKVPGKFLVDVIEEDFRTERVPHVGAKDRKSVITRMLDRFYRSSNDYCYSEVIGRDKDGRKDDVVLLGAMTNPQLIQPWISAIEECQVPLSGIWTLPLVSKGLLKSIKATSSAVLLVSQQVNSNVRQTLFRDGKIISSRQSIINQDMNDISETGKLAAPEVSRTMTYLRSQNLIKDDEVVEMHVIGSDEQMSSLQEHFISDENQTVILHNLSELVEGFGLKNVKLKFSDQLFAWLCAQQKFVPSHYGAAERFKRYKDRMTANALYLASVSILVMAALITESNISDAMEYETSVGLLKKQESTYRGLYSKKFKDFEGVFENAGVMNAAVELADRIEKNSETSPLDFMLMLSGVLNQVKGVGIQIDKINWTAVNQGDERNQDKLQKANFTSSDEVLHDAVIRGRIEESEFNYRASVEKIRTLIDNISTSPRVLNVEIINMPVDIRPDSKFASQSGIDNKEKDSSLSGAFTIKVTMRAS